MPIVLVTGAGRGLGFEFARQYAAAGWRVIATCRAPEAVRPLQALGPGVVVFRLDLADLAAVAGLERELAGETIDLVIANAGVSGPRDMTAETVASHWQAWEDTFRVNVMAPLALAGALVGPVMNGEGRKMIAISSRLGSMGANGDGGLYAYRSSKAALNAVWRSFALDHPEIIAAVLHPGWVRTDMGGARALLSPEDSVAGMRRVIARLAKADSGRFYNHDGSPIPW